MSTNSIKYPNIIVDLSTVDGNAFSIMGAVTRAMKKHGVSNDEINQYRKEATSGDYSNLLAVTEEWVTVEYSEVADYDDDDDDDDYEY